MSVQKTKAVVIGYHLLGEVDKIVIFCTRDFGNIRAVAKGVRKVKSRLCGRMEILTYGEMVFYRRENKELHIVNSFDIIESFQILREDLLKMAYCSYLAELIQQIELPEMPNTELFDLFLDILYMMKNSDDPEILVRAFEIRVLSNAGFNPNLDSCVVCSDEIRGINLLFDIEKGGVICGKCGSQNKIQTTSISLGTLELMRKMQQNSLEFITRLRMLESSRRELRRLLSNYIAFHLDSKHFRSLEFLASMEGEH